jgi:hypothetical protein
MHQRADFKAFESEVMTLFPMRRYAFGLYSGADRISE